MSYLELQGRPLIEKQSSGLRKLTRFYKVDPAGATQATIESEAFITIGTADVEFTSAFLTGQALERRSEQGVVFTLTRVYQELADNALTATTEVGESTLFDGRRVTRTVYLCKASQAASLRPAIGGGVFQVEITKDGPVAKVTKFEVALTNSGFTYAQSDETRHNGALLLRTVRTLGQTVAPPSGYTEISSGTQQQDGYTIYSQTFAKGSGEISRQVDYSQSSDQGATGVTRTIIRHLTPTSTVSDPTALVGSVKVGEDKSDSDGYRLWTITYAKGTGLVVDGKDTREGGKLIVYSRVQLGSAPSAPSATIAGAVVLIADKVRKEAGFDVYERTWAEGSGTVSSSVETKEGGKLIVYRKTALGTAPSAPIATIAGTVTLIADSSRDSNGHTIYERTWAEGIGEISRDTRYSQSSDQGTTGATVITVRHLTAITTVINPISTPAGTVLISEAKQDQDGYRFWTATYAKGAGTVLTEVDTRNCGKLIIYHTVKLGSAPSAPAATIGGIVTAIKTNVREAEGYIAYDYAWAEGIGIIGERTQTRDGGLLLLNRDILVAPGTTDLTPYTPAGILLEKSYAELDGVRRWSATWIQKHDGTSPIAGTAVATASYVPFTYPGRAKYFSVAFTTGGYTSHTARDVFLSPPVQCLVLANVIITYQTSNAVGVLAYTLWNPTDWATLRARWIAWANSPRSKVEGLRGYRAVNSGASGTSGAGTDTSVLGDRVYATTDWEISLSGGPVDPGAVGANTWTLDARVDPEPAFIGYDGTRYYRRTVVEATIPAQAALPV